MTRLWGLTALDAYLAYNDSTMLDFAVKMWNQTVAYQLTDRDVDDGFSKIQNATIPARCKGSECTSRTSVRSSCGDAKIKIKDPD